MRRIVLVSLAILWPVVCLATTINVPSEQSTIQAGIDAASDGDTVLVAAGTYTGDGNRDIDFHGKSIALVSEAGADQTIIDCEGTESELHRGFDFHSGEDSLSVVAGFTVINGHHGAGGAISCQGSSPMIRDCEMRNCLVEWSGGAAYIESSSPIFTSCDFVENEGKWKGGAIVCYSASPSFDSCNFIGNIGSFSAGCIPDYEGGGAIAALDDSWVTMRSCSFRQNTCNCFGKAIHAAYSSTVEATDCVIDSNLDGMSAVSLVWGGTAIFTNCSIIRHSGTAGYAVFSYAWSSTHLTNCSIVSNAGGILVSWEGSVTLDRSVIANSTTYEAVNCDGWKGDRDKSGSIDFSISCTNFHNNAGGNWVGCVAGLGVIDNNFSLNPRFCDPQNGDYTINANSPCAAEFSPCGQSVGAYDPGCEWYTCGDADGSESIDIDDVVHLIEYIFMGGIPPLPHEAGDVDCSQGVDIDDVVYLINYIFAGGPEPCAACS